MEEHVYQGRPVFVVTVPYQPREMFATDGRVLVRRGTENVPAASHEITALASRRGQLHYETEVPLEATLDDLDLSLLEGYRAAYERKRGRRLTLPDLKKNTRSSHLCPALRRCLAALSSPSTPPT